MHRFFVPVQNIKANKIYIEGEQAHHIEKVLRLKPGTEICLFDGEGTQYYAIISGREKDSLVAEIKTKNSENNEPRIRLALVQGIAKGEKMDTIIQKAVEIGVKDIYPLQSERTVVQLKGEKARKKVGRWQIIARESCKQCHRNVIPEIKPVISFNDLPGVIGEKPAVLLYENEQTVRLKTVLKAHSETIINLGLFVIVGPEGGFSPGEIEIARQNGFLMAGLGPRILRTETAGIVVPGLVLYELDDLG